MPPLCHLLHRQAKKLLEQYDADENRALDREEFTYLVARLRAPVPAPIPLPAPPAGSGAAAPRQRAGPWRQGYKGNILYIPGEVKVHLSCEAW